MWYFVIIIKQNGLLWYLMIIMMIFDIILHLDDNILMSLESVTIPNYLYFLI